MHIRITTGVIRLVRQGSGRFFGGPMYKGELTATWGHGRERHYFPNYNFTLGRPEAYYPERPVWLDER